MWLVVGLGNPGEEYERTRHNIGFMVADELARRWKAPGWREKFGGEIAQTQDIVVLRPQEYMNVSGQAVQRSWRAGLQALAGSTYWVCAQRIAESGISWTRSRRQH